MAELLYFLGNLVIWAVVFMIGGVVMIIGGDFIERGKALKGIPVFIFGFAIILGYAMYKCLTATGPSYLSRMFL